MAATATQLVFVGAGHAHLHALARLRRYRRAGASVTVINPTPWLYYSAVAVGMAAGTVTRPEARIDVQRLVTDGGGRFVCGSAHRVDTESRRVVVGDESVRWDLVSVDVGSTVPCPAAFVGDDRVLTAKPLTNLDVARERLIELSARDDHPVNVVVAGGGPTGCEVAGAASALALRCDLQDQACITVVSGSDRLLPDFPPVAGRRVEANFVARGVRILGGCRVVGPSASGIALSDGAELPCDLLVWAAGPVVSGLPAASQLPVDEAGAVQVDEHLQCVGADDVFAAGDGARLVDHPPMAKAGVYAIRQGPVLHHNLLARLTGGRLRAYRPQRRALLILNLGDGVGVAVRGKWVWSGAQALRFKRWLDRGFLRTYRAGG